MKFENYKNMIERPYYVTCDTECCPCDNEHEKRVSIHKPNSCCSYFVCTHDNTKNELKEFVGEDCIVEMLKYLHKKAEECIEEMENVEVLRMTEENWKTYNAQNHCHICKEWIRKDQRKVRDHCHITGDFRGAAHDKCNIQYFSNRFLPVIFHNLKGYDGHLIIRKAREMMDALGIEKKKISNTKLE
jgi:hypothetical protein